MKNSQRGFTPLLVFLLIAVLTIGGSIYYLGAKTKSDQLLQTEAVNKNATNTPTATTLPSIKVSLPDGEESYTINDDGFFHMQFEWFSNVTLVNPQIVVKQYDFVQRYNFEEAPTYISKSLSDGGVDRGAVILTHSDIVKNSPLLMADIKYIAYVCGDIQNTGQYICSNSDAVFTLRYRSDLISISITSPQAGQVWRVDSANSIEWQSKGMKEVQIYIVGTDSNGYTNLIVLNGGKSVKASDGRFSWYLDPREIPLRDGTSNFNLDSSKLFDQYQIRIDEADGLSEDRTPIVQAFSKSFKIRK
ncbi:GPI anchored serine-threonine rich family protein [Candidatus Parcubacteria bacterium]|nr:GPI anchored serine-threonine rich family protein [Candidatus Parcubacteria bacterium]